MWEEAPLSTMCILLFDFVLVLGLDVLSSTIGEQPLKNLILLLSCTALGGVPTLSVVPDILDALSNLASNPSHRERLDSCLDKLVFV